MHHAFAVLFLVSLGLGASPGSAAADPVESDKFKFTWLGVPIGEVTLHYGRYEDPNRAFGLERSALTETPTRMSARQSRELADGEHEDRGPVQSPRLGALAGRTNGLVRWLKRYEGSYRTTLTSSGSRYEVTAMDQGVPEARDIWFGAKPTATPQVLDFQDRSSADPLQTLTGVDEGSVDPVRLMALILKAIESHNGCPATPDVFRVFDGKRRYEAQLSNPSRVDASVLSDLAANGSEMTNSGGSSASGSEAYAAYRKGGESVSDLDGRNERQGDLDRHQFKSTEIAISVAQESERVVGPALQNPVPHTVECRLTLVAREAPKDLRGASMRSEIKGNGKPAPAASSGQAAVDPIHRQKQGGLSDEIAASDRIADPLSLRGTAESRSSAGEAEYEEGQQGQDLSMQQGLFWPFNRQDLTVDFFVNLSVDGSRFRSFVIRAPVGHVRGRLANGE